jgi:glutathione S-transferase
VNNESADITRMLCNAFDNLLPLEQREMHKGPTGLIPTHLRHEIDDLNAWVFDTINNGVYKVGFATSQAAYDEHITKLFQSLDRLEHLFSQTGHHPYLFGDHITEADIRLFTTLIRFDVAYHTLFKCNMKMIRLDYPRLHAWLRRLYWSQGPETAGGAFKNTTHFDAVGHFGHVDCSGANQDRSGVDILPLQRAMVLCPLVQCLQLCQYSRFSYVLLFHFRIQTFLNVLVCYFCISRPADPPDLVSNPVPTRHHVRDSFIPASR